MDYEVIFTPDCFKGLEEAVRYVAQDNPAEAVKLGHRLVDDALSLARMPQRGTMVRRRPGMRKLLCRPYLIYYRIDEDAGIVKVLSFRHAARHWS